MTHFKLMLSLGFGIAKRCHVLPLVSSLELDHYPRSSSEQRRSLLPFGCEVNRTLHETAKC